MANNSHSVNGLKGARARWGNLTPDERFWRHVNVGVPDQCWEWKTKTSTTYPLFKLGDYETSAHRIAWILAKGPIPCGLCVLHKCDNPRCVNPSHLWLGTHKDNAVDREQKNRGNRKHKLPSRKGCVPWSKGLTGDANPLTKHPDKLVKQVREMHRRYEFTARQIAAKLGLGYHVIRNLIYHRH